MEKRTNCNRLVFFVRLKINYIFTTYCGLHNSYLNTIIINYSLKPIDFIQLAFLINYFILAI